jgi:uncharacterized protein
MVDKRGNTVRIGEVSAEPSSLVKGGLAIGMRMDGSRLRAPMLIVNGAHPGPNLWLLGCTHGDEYAGSRAIHHFLSSVSPSEVHGTFTALPVVNLLAWENKKRESDIDHLDLNRVFPGRADGTYTQRLAWNLTSILGAHADYVIDLHGYRSNYFALYFRFGNRASRIARKMCLASGSPAVSGLAEKWLETSMAATLTRKGVPAILIEAPGEGRLDAEIIDYHIECIRNISIAMGLLKGKIKRPPSPAVETKSLVPVRVGASGFVDSLVRRGDRVRKEQVLARISDAYGDPVAEVISPVAGLVLNLDTHGLLHQGEVLLMIGEPR